MSVAGFKKQFHKASQVFHSFLVKGHSSLVTVDRGQMLLSEKISGAEGTKHDHDFVTMEKKIDITNKAIFDLLSKTTEYLQPNPAYRAKLGMLNTVSKMRGQVKTVGYPQTEGMLGDVMLRYGRELGEDSSFGCALVDVGEAMKLMADVKDSLDISVKQNFIDPLQSLQDKELKEIGHHLKKLEGRRLDFDYKKKRQAKIPEEEVRQAVEKFDESRELAERSMINFLESDVEQVSQLAALVEAGLDYHRQSLEILEEVNSRLKSRISMESHRPKKEFKPKSVKSSLEAIESLPHNGLSYSSSIKSSGSLVNHTINGKNELISSPPLIWPDSPQTDLSCDCAPADSEAPLDQPCCRALYDFEPENAGELGFKEGDLIILTNQIDENWYEGMIHGESGFFPISYINVIVPLPQ